MDVKSAFLYGTINEEVYVMQPLRYQDPEFLARVYKVEKAMYGLHQAPRSWLHSFVFVTHYHYVIYIVDSLTQVMSSDSHATITYTLMSSYEAPPSPDYIPGPEAPPSLDYIPEPEEPPSLDYIPGPEAPPSPDYIPGPEYPEYLPQADDVFLA
nr:ribonuclease H-like domain-containing protein [Tanacetum cinerariifolium]